MSATAGLNPYPGLRPFREDEEYLFFGREAQVDTMVDKLAATHFLAVVGSSGSGKSSLVNCGLRPALHRGLMVSAGSAWRMAQFRPGSAPVQALAAALAADGLLYSGYRGEVPLHEVIETRLQASKRGLVDLWERARPPAGTHLLVVVDQFEELFRYQGLAAGGADPEAVAAATTAFVNLLLEPRAHPDCRIHVVITMRSDFLGECARFYGLPEAINAGQYLVPRLTREERRAAIAGPVGVGGATIDPVLLTRLLNDVGDNPDQLSILQHALNRTWDCWEQAGRQGPLTLAHYEAAGTMAHALDRHAETAFQPLSPARQALCERLFRALTDKGTDARGIRRPTALADLCAIAGADAAEVVAVIDAFRAPGLSFLMPPAAEPLTAAIVVDISHESLMRVWQRLRRWSEQEALVAGIYRRLVQTARLHRDGQAELLRGPELERALDARRNEGLNAAWARQYGGDFEIVSDFLQRSAEACDAQAAAQRSRRRLIRVLLGLLALGLVVFSGFTVYSEKRVQDALATARAALATAQHDEARARESAEAAAVAEEKARTLARAYEGIAVEAKRSEAALKVALAQAEQSAAAARRSDAKARAVQEQLDQLRARGEVVAPPPVAAATLIGALLSTPAGKELAQGQTRAMRPAPSASAPASTPAAAVRVDPGKSLATELPAAGPAPPASAAASAPAPVAMPTPAPALPPPPPAPAPVVAAPAPREPELSDRQLVAIMPRLQRHRDCNVWLQVLNAAMAEFGITSTPRRAAFLAQIAVETEELRVVEEVWVPTEFQRRYEPPGSLASSLGNTQRGDGERYRGRGLIQITGRRNYEANGALIGVDLVARPERAAEPAIAARLAGAFWQRGRLNALADAGNLELITRRINGGVRGLEQRQAYFDRASAVLQPGALGPAAPGCLASNGAFGRDR